MKRTNSLRRTKLRPYSKKREAAQREYLKARTCFLIAHPYCQASIHLLGLEESDVIGWNGLYRDLFGVFQPIPHSQDIHHKAGRIGTNLLDTTTWMAVSRAQHDRIHANPKWAREIGFLTP